MFLEWKHLQWQQSRYLQRTDDQAIHKILFCKELGSHPLSSDIHAQGPQYKDRKRRLPQFISRALEQGILQGHRNCNSEWLVNKYVGPKQLHQFQYFVSRVIPMLFSNMYTIIYLHTPELQRLKNKSTFVKQNQNRKILVE